MIYKICFRLLIGVSLLLQWQRGISQDTTGRVTLDLKQASMGDVLKEVERQSGYRLYYDTADLDTSKIDIHVQQESFYKVLDQVFSGTGISYSIDRTMKSSSQRVGWSIPACHQVFSIRPYRKRARWLQEI